MGHVKHKKSSNNTASTPPGAGTELVVTKEHVPHSTHSREYHSRPAYPEQLNVEELISQINCRNSHSEITNDSNNNNNSNNNAIHRTANQQLGCTVEESVDVEKGSESEQQHRQKPLYRRLITFIRNLWIGATFNVGKDGKQSAIICFRYFTFFSFFFFTMSVIF